MHWKIIFVVNTLGRRSLLNQIDQSLPKNSDMESNIHMKQRSVSCIGIIYVYNTYKVIVGV